jgi:hypothetical protein
LKNFKEEKMERLSTAVPPIEDRSKYLRELAGGFEKGQIFLTALELDIFTLLETPKNAQEVAETLETLPHITYRFLDVLASMHLLIKKGDRYVTASDVAPFMVKDAPYSARYLNFAAKSRKAWMKLAETMKTGPIEKAEPHDHDYNQPCIDWMARGTLLGRLQGTVKHLGELPEFQAARKLVDLGGGHGLFGIAFAQENPDLEVVIFDKPEVTPMTQGYIDRYGMQGRVTTMSGDYTRDHIGSGYDIAFEACSFGGRGDEALAFYRQVAAALKDNGLFIRLTFTLDDDRSGPLTSLIWDLKEQITGHSHMHMKTTSELYEILAEAGFQQERTISTEQWSKMETRLIVARKISG